MEIRKYLTKDKALFLVVTLAYSLYMITNYLHLNYYSTHIFIDDIIQFSPVFIYFYILLYPLLFLPFIVHFTNKEEFRKACYAIIALNIIEAIFFVVYPTTITRPNITGGGLTNFLLSAIYTIDPPHNLFPSLHVSGILLGFFIYIRKSNKYFILLPLVMVIILSTVFVKQHYFLDIIAGVALALLVYLIIYRNK